MCPESQQRPTQSNANKHFLPLIRNVQILASLRRAREKADRQITTKTQQARITECISRHYIQHMNIKVQLKAGIHCTLLSFCPDLQSGQVTASCRKPEPVCRFELTDFIDNLVVCDGHRLWFLASMYPSCSYQKYQISEHILLSVLCISYDNISEFVVFGMNYEHFSTCIKNRKHTTLWCCLRTIMKVYHLKERSYWSFLLLTAVGWSCGPLCFMVIVVPHSEITTLCTSLTNDQLC